MKLFVFLLGIVVGAGGYHYYHKPECDAARDTAASGTATANPAAERSFTEKARNGALAAKEAISQKLVDWNLTPAEINRELEETGRVVRQKTANAGQSLSNARIAAVIKGKYALDDELSARAITVDVDAGRVTLRGSAKSSEAIARAIALALETNDVTAVDSQLTVAP
jgi:Predicted periplasmic or secreted lipoprotein